jgi:hypothetical protein
MELGAVELLLAFLLVAATVIYWLFFRGDTSTKTSFNPTPGGATAFKVGLERCETWWSWSSLQFAV